MALPIKNKSIIASRAKELAAKRREEEEKKKQEEERRQAMLKRQEERAQKLDNLLKKPAQDQRPSYQKGTGNNYYNPNMPTKKPEEIVPKSAQKSGNIWSGMPQKKTVSELLGEKAKKLTTTQRQKVLDPFGKYGKGNIDLNNRQVKRNADGSISTEFSTTVGFDDRVELLPTIIGGKEVSEEDAIQHYLKTGETLGSFNTGKEADVYANMLHLRQQDRYRDEADKWAAQNAKEQEGKNNVLKKYGVPFAYNKDGGVVPVDAGKWDMNDRNNQYLKGRPEDYEGNEYDYDRAAYDWVHGIGEYDKRVEALDTDEDVDALDAEVRKIWDSVERSFREPRVFTKAENPQGYPHSFDMRPDRPYKDYVGNVTIGGQERPMTPEEIYENADPKLRGQAADQLLSQKLYQGWLNRNPYLKYANMGEDKENWLKVQQDAELRKQEGYEKLQQGLDEWEPGDPFYDNMIDEIKAGGMPDVISTPVRSEENDRALMDFYYGDGFYDEWEGDPEREEKLQELWAPIEDGSLAAYRDKREGYKTEQTETEYAQRMGRVAEGQLKENERLQKEMQGYNDLLNQYGEVQRPEYMPEYDRGETNKGYLYSDDDKVSDIHRIASFVGGGNEMKTYAEAYGSNGNINVTNDYQYAMMMLDGSNGGYDEIGKFLELYYADVKAGREPTQAQAFLEGLQPYLRSRYEYAEKINDSEFARNMPVVASLASLAAHQINTFVDPVRHVAHLFGDKSTEDYNSKWYRGSRFSEQVEGTIAKDLGEVGGKIYSGVMNSASNLLRALAAPKGSKLAQSIGGLGTFFLQVDQEATARYLKDHSYDEAATMGAVDALFEVAEEFLPFETMLGTANKGLLSSMVINGLSELGQEFTGATLGEKLKGMILGEDPETARADEIVAQQGYEKNGEWVDLSGLPKDQMMEAADVRAAHEFWTQAAEQGLGGMFGGFLGGTYGSIMKAANTIKTGKKINAQQNTTEGVTGGEQLVKAAAGMDGTESQELAQKIQEKQEKGKTISNYEIGKLAATVIQESGEKIAAITKETLETRMMDQLKKENVTGKQAKEIAEAITKSLTTGELTKEEQLAIGTSKAGLQLWKSYNSFTSEDFQGAVAAVNAATAEMKSAQKSVMDLMTEPDSREMTAEMTRGMMDGAEWLQGDALKDVQDKLTGKATEVVTGGEVAEVVGFGTQQVEDEDGKKHTMATVKLSNGEEVSIADITATSEAAAKVLKFLQNEAGKSIGNHLGAKVLEMSGKVKDTAKLMTDAVNVMWSEWLGTGKAKTSLSAEDEAQLRQAVQADIQADDKKRLQGQKEIRPGEGRVTFDGKEAGTEEYDSALKDLDGKIRKEAEYIADLMKSAGMNVEMYYDESESAKQGAFNGGENGEGIRINLAGTFNAAGVHRSAVATVGHEATHWLAANAPTAYKQMRSFVLQNLQNSGVDIKAELRGIMDNYELHGESLDLGGAIDEIVAMGYEQVLTNEQLVRDLKEQDPSLFGKVKQAVQAILNRIRGIKNDVIMTSSRFARALMNVADRAAQIWGIAYKEATAAEGEGTGNAAQMSLRMDDEYMDAVNAGDMEAAQAMVDEYAAAEGYNIRAYHGTGRADRVGTVFLPERATSGPMAYFTDSKDIATNYSRDKKDTSVAYDEEYGDYHNQFRYKQKNGKTIPIGKLWSMLSWDSRQKITEAAKHITLDDEAEEIIWDDDAQYGVGNFTDYERKLHNYNSIETLIDGWLDGGTLWQREGDFLKVLELAGLPMDQIVWMNPDYREEKVYDTYLKIQNPFDTSTMYTEEFIDGLEAWWAEQDQEKYDKEGMGADFWDKNNTTVEEFAEYARDEIPQGRTGNWTRIPDAVSDYLKSLGYDGIKDQGGKGGGAGHTVWIPFTSEQIKSAESITYDNNGNIIPLEDRFDDSKKDIRWSMRDDTDYDVRQWMETVPEWSLQTEAEKTLLKKYGNLRRRTELDRERMRKIDRDLLNLEAQLVDERHGRIEAKETLENMLESAGVSVKDERWLQKDGKIIAKIEADGTFTMDRGADSKVYADMKAAGFMFNGRKVTYRTEALGVPTRADGKPSISVLLGKSEALRQRDALQKKKDDLQKKMDETEEELSRILSDEGFAQLMFRQNKVLEDIQNFKTQQELMDYVARMEKTANEIAERIEKNKKAVDALEKGGIVEKFRELLGTTSAEQAAADLKKEYHSTWTAKQIRAYLDPIILKMKTGADFQADVETLAGILVSTDSRNRYETLEELRGLTITLGKGAQQELKAQNSSLKEVRARLAGTGITVKYGERSTLEADIEDLRAEYPMIPELGDEKDALGNFLNWIDSMKSASAGMEFYDQRLAEAMAVVTGKAAGAAKGIYMPNDVKAQQQVMAMMNFVKSLNAETAEAQKALADVAKQMEAMQKTGMLASNKATTLMRDVNVALDYYNRISRIAVDEAKETKTSALIEQLKSKQAQEILKNNEEWRNLIQRDKEAREQLEDNRKHVRMINTCLKRMWKRLKAPKGTDNIPERMQGLAREVLGMFVRNDLGYGMRFLNATQDGLMEMQRVLAAWEAQDGKFDEEQLKDLADGVQESIVLDLEKIREGLKDINQKLKGKNKKDFLEQRGAIISTIQEGVSEIYYAIKAEQEVFSNGQKVKVEDAAYAVAQGTNGKQFREWSGKAGGAVAMLHKAIISGNMTPEYFFRTLGNEGLSALWENYHRAENRNGLELKKAQERLAKIAEEYGYKNWDLEQKITLELESGNVDVTLGQLMSLWATWKREQTLGPAQSEHLTKGGFYAEKDLRAGILGREAVEKRAHTVTEEDMAKAKDLLTEEQRKFVDAVVGYMSNEMSELGNEASMAAYGIKLYKEAYYFPFQIWNGVKSRKSNEAGGAAAAQDRAFHPSFAKSRLHGANNAVMIGDFMQTATDHIAGMINYATMGLANESLMKVLNQQTTAEAYGTKRNTEAILEEAYGKTAMQYLRELQKQLNGGAVKIDKTFYDKLISLFRKNAVAGSISVALQQPLSYLRAAMLIDARYLTRAISPDMWKGSYKEMMEHSGVAVIKEMGRFDMNFGASAREYLTPDGKEGKVRKAWNWATDKLTILPEMMDRMTWTRMWSAVKAEQHAQNPNMDMKSREFLDKCGERFNELMRRTQVYDSVLVKSANMRSQNPAMKVLTSFMAEPSLTLNVLADSYRMAIQKEKGGVKMAGKASAIFMLSAALQAAIKGAVGARRNPDDKKTWGENFWYRFWMNFWGEVDPMQLVPGYDEMATLIKGGDIKDDAFGSLSKLFKSVDNVAALLRGDVDDTWRGVEDSVGQLAQLVTKLPVKNIMRDLRATYNWVLADPYAKREDSEAVLKYQFKDVALTADTLLGIILNKLGEAGYDTSTSAYIGRIYNAKREGREQEAQDMIYYLINGKGVKEKSVTSKIGTYAMNQYAEGNISREEAGEAYREAHPKAKDKDVLAALDKVEYEKENGDVDSYSNYTPIKDAMDAGDDRALKEAKEYLLKNGYTEKEITAAMKSYITDQYKDGDITKQDAERMLKKYQPGMSADDIFWALDLIDYKNETGDMDASGNYYRLKGAIREGKSEDIRKAAQMMLAHGYDQKKIKNWLANKDTGFKTAYLNATGNEKVRIKNALIQAYKAIGISENEANRIINKWK